MDSGVLPTIQTALSDAAPQLAQLSKFLWENPELGLQEEKAHNAITQLLQDLGFRVQRQAVLPTGFIASHSSSESDNMRPHVAIMCEYDALPNIGHACGHNLIATCAVGAALAVRAVMLRCAIVGRVSVFGTPAEESTGGKTKFVAAEKFGDVDAAMMVHPVGGRQNIVAPGLNSSATFKVEFSGKSSHAASIPWEGVNALDAAVLAYQNIAVMRQQFQTAWRAPVIITKGGDVVNVIPDRTEIVCNLRADSHIGSIELERKWHACIDAAATATGCTYNITSLRTSYMCLNSNNALAAVFSEKAKEQAIPYIKSKFLGGSSDMGNVSHVVPSIHPMFYIESAAELHQNDFTKDTGRETTQKFVNEQAMLLALTAVEVLTNGHLREEMRKEMAATKETELTKATEK